MVFSFSPERFIDGNGEYIPPKESFAPFGAGSRTCLGMHLVKMELRLGAAEFFRECAGAKVSESMGPEDMEFATFSLVSPKGNRCCVRLS
jgi:cytochrome P450